MDMTVFLDVLIGLVLGYIGGFYYRGYRDLKLKHRNGIQRLAQKRIDTAKNIGNRIANAIMHDFPETHTISMNVGNGRWMVQTRKTSNPQSQLLMRVLINTSAYELEFMGRYSNGMHSVDNPSVVKAIDDILKGIPDRSVKAS